MIDDTNDINIDPVNVFLIEDEFPLENKVVKEIETLDKSIFFNDYHQMISTHSFYIKLPLNIFLKGNREEMIKSLGNSNKSANLKSTQFEFIQKVKNF